MLFRSNYQKQKLAKTFIICAINTNIPIAYFSILNDALNVKHIPGNSKNKFNRKFPNNKRMNHYPAIKIGRIGVIKEIQKSGFAYLLMDFIKEFSVKNLNAACRLLILDAINEPKQIKYYQKNGFLFLMESDTENKTRLMYFDLINFT